MTWEVVIGIETHVELRTESKMFCGCPVGFGAEPNTAVCPVCLGLPGALPVPNEKAIEWTMRLGLALDCDVTQQSLFHRKNYFYADMPKNYQISQFDFPLCVGGHLDVTTSDGDRRIGITRVHLEEDTGKSTHLGEGGRIGSSGGALVDFNRAGIPLMEVVSEPDIRTPEEARVYAQELRAVVLALGVSDARLEEGSMRFDANISLRSEGATELGVKVEVKNMNSLRSLQRALSHEIERQTKILDEGGAIAQETRHWDEEAGRTEAGRSKEEASDYRYFSEPDLVPLVVTDEVVAGLRSELPELPAQTRARFEAAGVDSIAARVLVGGSLGSLFDEAVVAGAAAPEVAKWLTGEVTAHLNREGADPPALSLDGAALAELIAMVEAGDLSSTAAKQVLEGVLTGEGQPRQVAEARDLIQIRDEEALAEAVAAVVAAHPEEMGRIADGDGKLIGFLVGQVMKATGGKADPRRVSELIRESS
ncbi:MAG: Asp-tRNA(Asn)/Glu-tRNA(Gln) amidotransferase subunit GatB [Acidobacteria bacterium]|nr:Asp-tRNA(Asn)/Glu-tRNA(Gln) amidotransferase subunit GatB [Acidobacteriota bacterium]